MVCSIPHSDRQSRNHTPSAAQWPSRSGPPHAPPAPATNTHSGPHSTARGWAQRAAGGEAQAEPSQPRRDGVGRSHGPLGRPSAQPLNRLTPSRLSRCHAHSHGGFISGTYFSTSVVKPLKACPRSACRGRGRGAASPGRPAHLGRSGTGRCPARSWAGRGLGRSCCSPAACRRPSRLQLQGQSGGLHCASCRTAVPVASAWGGRWGRPGGDPSPQKHGPSCSDCPQRPSPACLSLDGPAFSSAWGSVG